MNFMASEYQADAMQYRSRPCSVRVTGASADLFDDDDCFPNADLPHPFTVPTLSSAMQGELTVTPDKSSATFDRKFSLGNGARRTVTFNENIDVQLLSPSSSVSVVNSSLDMEKIHSRLHNTHQPHQNFGSLYTDQIELNPHVVKSLSLAETSSTEAKSTQLVRRNSLDSVDSAEITQSSEDSLEAIDVVASDIYAHEFLASNPLEHKLARPEFSSVLQIKKQKHKVQDSELDVENAVKEKLNISKTRTKVEEKAYQRLNRDDVQYKKLQCTEVAEEDVYRTERILTARANQQTLRSSDTSKKKQEPDILEFLADGFQKETGSYSVESFAKLQSTPQATDREHAFDVYQYVSAWEGW